METRRRNVTFVIVALGVAVLVVTGIYLERPIREYWLLSKLDSDDFEEWSHAAEKLVEMRSKQAEAKFIELLQTGEVNEKIPLAAWAVGKMRSVEATPALIQALRQTAPEVSRIEQTIGQEESRTSSKTRQSSRTWCCAWLGKIRAVATRESKVPSPIWAMRCLVEL